MPKHPIIRLVKNQCPGINNNFANALQYCSGDYIAFCDQDDIWHRQKLEYLLKAADTKAMLYYGGSTLIDSNQAPMDIASESFLGFTRYREGRVPFYFIFCNCVSGHDMMISKDLLPHLFPLPEEGCIYDHWTALVAALKGGICFVPQALTYHRIHGANSRNNSLLNARKKKEKGTQSKYGKFLKEQRGIRTRVDKGVQERAGLSAEDSIYWAKLAEKLAVLDGKLFDISLFAMLFRKRAELFEGHYFRECKNRSMGGRYFKIIDAIRRTRYEA